MDDQTLIEQLVTGHAPLIQDAFDHPENYVTLQRDQFNEVTRLAAIGYQAERNERVKQAAMGDRKSYPCRYDCGQTFTQTTNRNRHERKQHGKERGHES